VCNIVYIFEKEVSYVNQGCIYLISKNIILCEYYNLKDLIYSCDAKLNF